MLVPVQSPPRPPFSQASSGTSFAPDAEFTGTPLSGTTPLSVVFTDLSSSSPTSWAWDFGDGGTDTVQNPTHIYTAAGTYTVILTATNAIGSGQKTRVAYITVSVPVVTTTIQPSGGYPANPDYGRVKKRTARELGKERERFGIPDKVRIAIEAVAAQQAARLEQDSQKRFEELERELELRGIEWDARYLESLNAERERLINAEIALRLRQRLKDEEELMLLVLMAAV